MAAPINYSKWDHIEISDDEDDTHPNIHTPSLFKWRHEARVQRMEEMNSEKERISEGKKGIEARIVEAKKGQSESNQEELERQLKEWKLKEKELIDKEKQQPLNVDTIGQVVKSKSIINKAQTIQEKKSEEEIMSDYTKFKEKYGDDAKKFGMFSRLEDSQRFLSDNPHLVCEHTASVLCIYCIDLEVEEKHELMEQVSHQAVILQFILELAKSLNQDPRGCFRQFFDRFKRPDDSIEYQEAFQDELRAFKGRVKGRAEARREAMMEEIEAEEKAERIANSPGGLDPIEVMNTLPKEWQECFEKKDIALLQNVVSQMDSKDAKEHLDRCIKSGLWVPAEEDKESPQIEELN